MLVGQRPAIQLIRGQDKAALAFQAAGALRRAGGEAAANAVDVKIRRAVAGRAAFAVVVWLLISNARNSVAMFFEPSAHFVVGPGPFNRLGVTLIVFGP